MLLSLKKSCLPATPYTSHAKAGQVAKQLAHVLVIKLNVKPIKVQPRCPVGARHNQFADIEGLGKPEATCSLHVRTIGLAPTKGAQLGCRIRGVGTT